VRGGWDKRPFCLTVSFTHPHDPYAITEDLWDLYKDVEIPLPKVFINQQDQDEHSKRILKQIDLWGRTLDEDSVRRARRAYFGACTYVDVSTRLYHTHLAVSNNTSQNQIGELLKTLEQCRLLDNTIIVFSGDHGDMLGERGLWYKMYIIINLKLVPRVPTDRCDRSWYEGSARVPMIINYPKLFSPRRVPESVSTMDLPRTFLDLVGGQLPRFLKLDGQSLYPALLGKPVKGEVFGEYMGETTETPIMMIKRGHMKYVVSLAEPPAEDIYIPSADVTLWEQFYDLKEDPLELHDLMHSANPKHQALISVFREEARLKWDFVKIHQDVLKAQRDRRFCYRALKKGEYEAWDYEPKENAANKYIRSTMHLDELERFARYPPVDENGREQATLQPHGQAGAYGE
jgi:arylsulfatase A-like enzyme